MRSGGSKLSPEIRDGLRMLDKNLPWKVKMQEIVKLLRNTHAGNCLEIGANDGAVSYYLRKHGGTWHTVITDETSREKVADTVTDNVHVMHDWALPFAKGMFDVVIIVDLLEVAQADGAVIEECHRVLKSDGHLIICVARAKTFSFINTLRRLLGATTGLGDAYVGYSESELFTLLKHGFDVHAVRTFSRFCVEFIDSFVRSMARNIDVHSPDGGMRMKRLYAIANIFYVLAFQIDMLLFFTKGHQIIALANRRAWRSRNAPVLIDGRNISEAVLSPLK